MAKKLLFTTFIFILFTTTLFTQNKNQAYLNYIQSYYKLAQIQQREYGIPTSITLAQGLLESGAGQSDFVKSSNNHFGIKCHDWTGDKVYHDDDQQGECFRKYDKVLDSYEDHSLFLKNRPRYAFLFELSPTDYEGWAHGLKKAGYATDPAYAYKLISIIDTYELHKYDLNIQNASNTDTYANGRSKHSMGNVSAESEHEVYKSNRLKFIVSKPGDTYAGIADEFNKSEKRIREYNEINEFTVLQSGTQVYLQRKRSKAARGYDTYIVKEGDSMYSISQTFGIRIEKLYKLNKMPYSEGAKKGQILKLR
ncbi:MAG: glucosaminidase domain-containing protein [Paludibacter sp.]|nr:glucosaminidase domain-containing protein [Paludibacter sp.]